MLTRAQLLEYREIHRERLQSIEGLLAQQYQVRFASVLPHAEAGLSREG